MNVPLFTNCLKSLAIREERSSLKFFEHNKYSYFKTLFLCYRYLREERSSLKNCIECLCLKMESSFLNKLQKCLCIREERSSLKYFNQILT